jgi:hypothetical protein
MRRRDSTVNTENTAHFFASITKWRYLFDESCIVFPKQK